MNSELFKITSLNGYTPQIGHLVSMMNYARHTTLRAVQGLTVDQLDYLLDDESNSIGALLSHIASVEAMWQIRTFEGREPNQQEILEWGVGGKLGERARQAIKGQPFEFYTDKLISIRHKTLDEFKKIDDDWLYVQRDVNGKVWNNYFVWFHVLEDEINHRGQMRILRKRALKEPTMNS